MVSLFVDAQPRVDVTTTVTLVIVGMLILAVVDLWKQEVEDVATAALLAVASCSLAFQGVSLEQWLSGVLSAAVSFLIYLHLGTKGVMGGGDVKLSVVPALVLGAANPFLGVWWVACGLLLQQVIHVLVQRVGPPRAATTAYATPLVLPHVPAMAGAMVIATVIFPPFG